MKKIKIKNKKKLEKEGKNMESKLAFFSPRVCTKVEMHYDICWGEGEEEGQSAAEVSIAVFIDCLEQITVGGVGAGRPL